jgi:tungstate transport system ATP-binding protein
MSYLYKLQNIEQYYDGKKVLNIDNLTLEENQIIGFFGPNGSGKSTLLSLLSFINKPTKGEVSFNGIQNNKLDLEARHSIVILPQNPYLLKRTVYENIAYGLKLRKECDNLKEKVHEALTLVGLDISFSNRKWSALSGGETQRVALAARLILKPKVLILDEPTSGVDSNSAQLIKEAVLLAQEKYNTTILISSHDHNWLNHICDKRIALFQGELVQSGSVNLLFAPWEKDENNNLLKVFMDGQELTIQNSKLKKRDSVVMINSDSITICKKGCDYMINQDTLMGKISSIHQEPLSNHILVDFLISGVNFVCRLTRVEMKEQSLLPGDKININIDTSEVSWI